MKTPTRPLAALLLVTACADDASSSAEGSTGAVGTTTGASTDTGSSSGSGSTDGADSDSTSDGTSSGSETTGETGGQSSPLDQAVDAIGGADALTAWAGLEMAATGVRRNRFIEMEPDDVVDVATYAKTYSLDVAGDRLRVDTERTSVFESFQFFPPSAYSIVVDGQVGGLSEMALFAPPGNMPSQSVAALRTQQRLFNPHFFLREALADPELWDDGGEQDVDGVPHRVLTFAGSVAEIRLFIDTRSGFITKLETLENHTLVRDVPIEVRYGGWSSHGALAFPDSIALYSGGALVHEETRTAFELDPAFAADTFEFVPPTDNPMLDEEAYAFGEQTHEVVEGFFSLISFLNEDPELMSSQLAPGVTLLASAANSLVISYDDGLAVIEAPDSPRHGTSIVDSLGLTFPGLPITHIIQSHHHYDHAGGVRSLVAAGATAVVGNGTATLWDTVLSAESTIRPDVLSQSDVEPTVIEVDMDGTFTLEDENVTITVHHASDNAHSADMLIPVIDIGGQRFVYVSDLYNGGFGFTVVLGGPPSFFDVMRDKGIIDASCVSAVPLTIVPAHGIPQTLGESLAELAGLGIDVGCP